MIPQDSRTNFHEILRSSDISGKWVIDTSLPHTPGINRIRTSVIGLDPKANFAAYSKQGALDVEVTIVSGPSDPRAILFFTAKTKSTIRIVSQRTLYFLHI